MEFLYEEDLREKMDNEEFIYPDDDLMDVRGLSLTDGTIYINLSARQWKSLEEEQLITEIGKTIVHEIMHTSSEYSNDELICQIMAGQI